MAIIDLNGNYVKHVVETEDLKEKAEALLLEMLKESEEHVSSLSYRYEDFPEFNDTLDYPIKQFVSKMRELEIIVKKGKLQTSFLGVEQEEDYSDMRKAFMMEAMYYIENKGDGLNG